MQKVTSGKKLYEQVLEQLESRILQGVYQKGALLPTEKQLTEQFGVSRITIREALKVLNDSGIISTRRGYGSVVVLDGNDLRSSQNTYSDYRKDFLNSTKARLLIEPSIAAELARSATEAQIQELFKALDTSTPDEIFHHTMIRLVGNPVVEDWFQHLFTLETDGEYSRLVPPPRQKDIARNLEEQHQKIYESIRDHRPEHAFFYMRIHLEYVYETYQNFFNLIL